MSPGPRCILAAGLLALGCQAQPQTAPEATPIATIAFTEGPAADTAGNVYFTDLTSRRIFVLSSNGRLSAFRENSNGANGLVFDERGRLIACETGDATRGLPPRVTRKEAGSSTRSATLSTSPPTWRRSRRMSALRRASSSWIANGLVR